MSLATNEILKEARQEWEILSINKEGRYSMNVKGADFHYKGIPTPEAIFAVNAVKRITLKTAIFFPVQCVLKPKKIIDYVNETALIIIKPYFIESENKTEFAEEICKVMNLLFSKITKKGDADLASRIISLIFEYDAAYRFRLQDILSETTKKKLIKSPIKETNRLLKILYQRDYDAVSSKFKIMGKLLTYSLIIPKIRKAFKEALLQADFSKLQLDENDRYWTAQRVDYKFWGKTNQERLDWLKNKGYKIPSYQQVIR